MLDKKVSKCAIARILGVANEKEQAEYLFFFLSASIFTDEKRTIF
jgi:hypothetical protein